MHGGDVSGGTASGGSNTVVRSDDGEIVSPGFGRNGIATTICRQRTIAGRRRRLWDAEVSGGERRVRNITVIYH